MKHFKPPSQAGKVQGNPPPRPGLRAASADLATRKADHAGQGRRLSALRSLRADRRASTWEG